MKKKFKRFWREWGFSKEDSQIIAGAAGIVVTIASLYMLMWSIG